MYKMFTSCFRFMFEGVFNEGNKNERSNFQIAVYLWKLHFKLQALVIPYFFELGISLDKIQFFFEEGLIGTAFVQLVT